MDALSTGGLMDGISRDCWMDALCRGGRMDALSWVVGWMH